MFFSVAWLRLHLVSILLILPSIVQARDESLFTSSVSYCAPPDAILVQQFDIAYIKKNSSVTFNVSVASVVPNINVNASLLLNVYGMQPLDLHLDLCSLLGGALCPLPTYNFTGADSITLPASVLKSLKIPGIAYKIPDLEAFAQLKLTDVHTGEVRACVQSTLSNGWSTHQETVEWATGGTALLALLSAIWYSYVPQALAPIRFLDLFYLLQTIAVSSLWSLNYPSVYRAFTLNFSWALGLFPTLPTSSIQQSIDNMRRHTGGHVGTVNDGPAISLVNRKLSPYNFPPTGSGNALIAYLRNSVVKRADILVPDAKVLVGGEVQTVTSDSSNVLDAGFPIYVNSIGIATPNAFMTIFLIALMLVAIVAAALALGYFTLYLLNRSSSDTKRDLQTLKADYPAVARAWSLRWLLVALFPMFVFVFYQWTLKDSWLSILLSVVLLLAVSAPILLAGYSLLRQSRRFGDPSSLTSTITLSPFVTSYREERLYTIYPYLTAILVKSLVTAFGKGSGEVQAILITIIEFFFLMFLLILKPHRTRGSDVFASYLAITRFVCSGLTIAFSESIGLKPIPRVVIGIIIAVIFSVSVIVMFLNIVWHLPIWGYLPSRLRWRRRNQGAQELGSKTSLDRDASLVEKQVPAQVYEKTVAPSESDVHSPVIRPASSAYLYPRPGNPTPTHTMTNTPSSLGTSLLSPLSMLSNISDQPSVSQYSSTSMSSTLGETLPRRWSFQLSRPPSVSLTSPGHSTAGHSHRVGEYASSSGMRSARHSRTMSTPIEGRYGDESRLA